VDCPGIPRAREKAGPGLPAERAQVAGQGTRRPEGIPVYVVTRGGDFGIHCVDDSDRAFEKADAVMQALNALDAVMSNSGEAVRAT